MAKRGRPKGSKNIPKETTTTAVDYKKIEVIIRKVVEEVFHGMKSETTFIPPKRKGRKPKAP